MKIMLDTNTCIAIVKRKPPQVLKRFNAWRWKKRTPIGPLDTMIGAHAMTLGVTLATNNIREFSRIKGLTIVDWLGSSR